MKKLKIDLHEIKNASKEEKQFYKISANYITNILNGKEFWIDVRNDWEFLEEKNGISFVEFKKNLMMGKDDFNKASDYDIDLYVNFYTSFRNVVGYTTPKTWHTWFNRKFFKRFDYAEMAGHIFHEYLHNVGYGHTNANRDSLVYSLGYLMRDHVKLLIEDFNKPKNHYITPWYTRAWIKIKSWF